DAVAEAAIVLLEQGQIARWAKQCQQALAGFEVFAGFRDPAANRGADAAYTQRTPFEQTSDLRSELVVAQQVFRRGQEVFGGLKVVRNRNGGKLDNRVYLDPHVAHTTAVLKNGLGGFPRIVAIAGVEQRARFEQRQVRMRTPHSRGQQLQVDQNRGPPPSL